MVLPLRSCAEPMPDLTTSESPPADQVTEIRRIFATRPGIVVTWEGMQPRNNADSVAALEDELGQHYRKVLEVPVGRHTRQIYQRLPDGGAGPSGTGP